MRRWIVLLIVWICTIVWVCTAPFFKEFALAQRSGAGTFSGPNMCSDVVGQISQQTYCIDQTSGSLNVWNGSTYQLLSGTSTGFSTNTNVTHIITNSNAGATAQSSNLLQNDTGHRGGLSMDSSGWATPTATPWPPTYINKPDQLQVTTNAANGIASIDTNTTVYPATIGYTPFSWSAALYQGGIQNFVSFTAQGGVDGQAAAISVSNPQPGRGSYAAVYVGNDNGVPGGQGHYLVQQIESSNNIDNGPPDSALIQSNTTNGMYIYSLAGQMTQFATTTITEETNVGSTPTNIGQFSSTGFNILTGSLFLGGNNMFRSGTWTPTALCASGNPTSMDQSGNGQWWTVGNVLYYHGYMGWSVRTGGSGQGEIGGLPFPAVDFSNSGFRGGTVVSNATAASGGTILIGSVFNANTYIGLYESNFGGFGYVVPLGCANAFANQPSGAYIDGSYKYMTAY